MSRNPTPGGPAPAPALMAMAPVRRARWEEREGRVVVERPRPRRTTGLKGLWERISHRMSMPRIKLDEFGTFAWRQLDGRHTVEEVGKAMAREFGDRAEPAAERAGRFVAQLHELELVLLPGFDPEEEVAAARQDDHLYRPPPQPPEAVDGPASGGG